MYRVSIFFFNKKLIFRKMESSISRIIITDNKLKFKLQKTASKMFQNIHFMTYYLSYKFYEKN